MYVAEPDFEWVWVQTEMSWGAQHFNQNKQSQAAIKATKYWLAIENKCNPCWYIMSTLYKEAVNLLF